MGSKVRTTQAFVAVAAILGGVALVSSALDAHFSDPERFFIYLALTIAASLVQPRKSLASYLPLSINLPLILLAMLDLSRSEAVIIGCVATLVQALRTDLSRPADARPRVPVVAILVKVGIMAAVVAVASFAFRRILAPRDASTIVQLYLAAGLLFFANTLPAAILRPANESRSLREVWLDSFTLAFPYYLMAAAVAAVFRGGIISLDGILLAIPLIFITTRQFRAQSATLDQEKQHAKEMGELHLRAVEGLALAVESKNLQNTKGHLRRVQTFCMAIGQELKLGRDELEALRAAALLHDIGKLAVPEHIITKPGKLSPEEFAKMKIHPVVGAEIVEQVRFPYPVAPIVRAHHEKWDGSGYPYGLKETEIPIGARILTAVDFVDALTSDREYRLGLPHADALKLLAREAGRAFDPQVVEILVRRGDEFAAMAAEINARDAALPRAVLSLNATIERGETPAAGLEPAMVDQPKDVVSTMASIRKQNSSLMRLSEVVSDGGDAKALFAQVHQTLSTVIPHDAMLVFIRRANLLVPLEAYGWNRDLLLEMRVPVGRGLSGWVAEHGKPMVNGNPTVDPGFACAPETPLASALAMPASSDGEITGVIVLYSQQRDAFTRDHLRILVSAAARLAPAMRRAQVDKTPLDLEHRDPLTGLLDRARLLDRLGVELGEARDRGRHLTVAFCELQGTQELYATEGPASVDYVVQALGMALRRSCRGGDHVGRLSFETFALVLPGMSTNTMQSKQDRLTEIAEELHAEHPGILTLHFGHAQYPEDGDGAENLLAIARHRARNLTQQVEVSNHTS
jgi:diguanylate cyclase (GGDEF)-like protein/putative nucleotidyltransferase with HDIG domain